MPTTNAMVSERVDGSERREANSPKNPTQPPTAPTASRAIRSLWKSFRIRAAVMLLLAAAPAAAQVVDSIADNNDGNLGAGQYTLREAVLNVPDGGTITFDPAVFGTPQTITLTLGQMTVANKGFTITGPGIDLLTVSRPGGRVLNMSTPADCPLTLSDLTIADSGALSPNSSAVSSLSNLTARRVRWRDNLGPNGGALGLQSTTATPLTWTLEQCEFTGNDAQDGGGAVFVSAQSAVATTLVVRDSLFAGNTAPGSGGAIDLVTTFVGAGNSLQATFTNSTFSGNQSGVSGGAMSIEVGSSGSACGATLINCTVTDNSATLDGGGIMTVFAGATATLQNTIVAGNTAPDNPDLYANGLSSMNFAGGNLIGVRPGLSTFVTSGTNVVGSPLVPVNPHLGPLANNGGLFRSHALSASSLARELADAALLPLDVNDLDADGNVAEAIPYDQRGGDGAGPATDYPRVLGVSPDAGALEVPVAAVSPSVVVTITGDEEDLDYSVADISLREATGLVTNGGTITFDPVVFGAPQTITLTLGEIRMANKGFTITGPGIDLLTVSRLGGRVLNMSTPAVCPLTLSDLTIADSGSLGVAGSPVVSLSNLTARRVRWRDNLGPNGGALDLQSTTATPLTWTLEQCEFTGNDAQSNGGAVFVFPQSAVATTLAVRDSLFAGNTATGSGGAIGLVTNTAGAGNSLQATIVNSTFSGNQSGVNGGALSLTAGASGSACAGALINCTVTGNSATGTGGGIRLSNSGASINLQNTIVAGNTAPTGPEVRSLVAGALNIAGGNLIGDDTGINTPVVSGTNVIGTGVTPVNAQLGALANNGGLFRTHALLAASPALELGDVALLPLDVNDLDADGNVAEAIPYDQRGGDGAGAATDFPRVMGVAPDAGAFEALPLNWIVDITADEDDGNLAAGDVSLREAVANVANGGTITFSPAVFGVPQTITLTLGQFVVNNKGFTVVGPGRDLLTITNASGRVFLMNTVVDTPLTISELTIADSGNPAEQGAALYCRSNLTARRVRFENNEASVGAAALLLSQGGSPLTWTFDECEFVGNTVGGQGGAIIAQGQTAVANTLIIRDSLFDDNTGATGGALSLFPATTGPGNSLQATISNTTFSSNQSTGGAGAIFVDSAIGGATSNATLINCTVTGNSAVASSGGLFVSNDGDSSMVLRNTIVAGNTAGTIGPDIRCDLAGMVTIGGGNLIGNNANITAPIVSGTNVIGTAGSPVDARLLALANNGGATRTHALRWDSPAINLGDAANLPLDVNDRDGDLNVAETIPYDQRGGNGVAVGIDFLRTAYTAPDAGAFEVPTYIVNVVTDAPDANPGDGFAVTATPGETSLRAAIMESNVAPGPEVIAFDIPGAGPHVIQPGSALPQIVGTVAIDATTEPNYPEVAIAGFADVPIVELRGDLIAAPFTHGLTVQADDVAVRGLAINSFTGNGIIVANGADRTTLRGNYIGTTRDGLATAANGIQGVETFVGGLDLTVGGAGAEDGNLISGNAFNGINLVADADNAVIRGNRIGTDRTGTVDLGNGGNGVALLAGANNVVIGGSNAGEGNLISGNGGTGVSLDGNDSTIIQGNFVGTSVDGNAAIPNSVHGIFVIGGGSTGTQIGGTVPGAGNVISSNPASSIAFLNSGSATVAGNILGLRADGTASLGGTGGRVLVNNSDNITIGGNTPAHRNVISGSAGGSGIFANGGSSSLIVQGNYIGTDPTGTTAIPNASHGVLLFDAPGALVGGPTAAHGNVIAGQSGAGDSGINIAEASDNVEVRNNRIGTNAAGTAALGNETGIRIDGGDDATIEANLVSGNTGDGILVGPTSNTTTILANIIGLDATGAAALGNGGSGVDINAAASTTIGDNTVAERNFISSNGQSGIVGRGGATGLLVVNNYIGLATDGTTARVNTGDGIQLQDADGATIGGPGLNANTIVGQSDGIEVQANSTGTDIVNNRIGVSADGTTPLPSTQRAILVQGVGTEIFGNHLASAGGSILNISNVLGASVQNNLIGTNAVGAVEAGFGTVSVAVAVSNSTDVFIGGLGAGVGNTIAGAGQQGIAVGAGTNNAVVLGNSIFGNGLLGIDLGADNVTNNDGLLDADTGDNGLQNFPIILSAPAGGTLVTGRLESDANTIFRIELFTNTSCDASGNGEGQTLLDSFDVGTDATGLINWQRTVPVALATGTILTATATHPTNGTSEFSPCFTVPAASLVVDITTDEIDGNLAPGDVSLREAVANVASGGTVTFDPGVFGVPQTINLTLGSIQVTGLRVITIVGPGRDLLTVRNNTVPKQRILELQSATLVTTFTVSDMTLAEGSTTDAFGGGAILSRRPLTLRRLRLTDNTTTTNGGAVAIIGEGVGGQTYPFIIDRCQFDNNDAAFGGAVHFSTIAFAGDSSLTVRDSLFVGNTGSSNAGAMALYPSTGGGVQTTIITNSTITGNGAGPGGGGAIDVFPTTLSATALVRLVNCTVTSNSAGIAPGGGILAVAPAGVEVRLRNSIVAGNTAATGPDINSNIAGSVRIEGGNVIGNNGGITAPVVAGTNQIGTPGTPINPQLVALADNGGLTRTHALLANSPALNLGDNALLELDIFDLDGDTVTAEAIPYDQRGGDGAGAATDYPRVLNGNPDAGAFEFPSLASLVVDIVADENDGNLAPGDVSLREAVAYINNGGTITFDPAVFGVAQTINLTLGEMAVTNKGYTLTGPGIDLLTVRRDAAGPANARLFNMAGNAPVTITDMTLADGGGLTSGVFGGGISTSADLTLRRVRVRDCRGDFGGGVFVATNGAPRAIIIDRCEIIGNEVVANGGGLFLGQATANTFASTVTIRDSLIANNRAPSGSGGGLRLSADGSAVGASNTATIINTTISGNQSLASAASLVSPGGAVATVDATFINCTVTGNQATGNTGGLTLGAVRSTMTLRNTIVAANTAGASWPDLRATTPVAVSGGNLIGNDSGLVGPTITGTNVIGTAATPVNPRLDPLANNGGLFRTHALQSSSPARNLGNVASLPADVNDLDADGNVAEPIPYDQRGGDGAGAATDYPRVIGSAPDSGAFESTSADIIVDIVADENDGDLSPGDVSLREAVLNVPDGASVLFDPVVFGVPRTINLTMGTMIVANKGITITGPGMDLLTVRTDAGSPAARVLSMSTYANCPLTISDITLASSGGNTIMGGAIVTLSPVAASRVRFANNVGSSGGAVLGLNLGLVPFVWSFDDCEFAGNQAASQGGALFFQTQGAATSQLIVRNSLFAGNSSVGLGGAVAAYPVAVGVGNNLVNLIANSTFSGNTSGSSAGALYFTSGGGGALCPTVVTNCTLTNNEAMAGSGGGILVGATGATLAIRNSIVAGNTATSTGPDVQSYPVGATSIEGGSIIGIIDGIDTPVLAGTNATGTLVAPLDARLFPLANNGGPTRTHALRWDSPAINLGDAALLPPDVNDLDGDGNVAEAIPYDQRGGNGAAAGIDFLRNVYGAPDAGAFELPTYIVNVITDAVDANPGDGIAVTATPGQTSLRSAIMESNAAPGPERVAFDIPGVGPHNIVVNSSGLGALPFVSGTTYIDATTEPDHPLAAVAGWTDNPVVSVVYSLNNGSPFGIDIRGADGLVRGLNLRGWSDAQVRLGPGAQRTAVQGCYFLTNQAGTTLNVGSQTGLQIQDGAGHRIGGSVEEQGNLFGIPNLAGAFVASTADGDIAFHNNRVGVQPSGLAPIVPSSPAGYGLWVESNNVTIGGGAPGERNLLAGMQQAAVRFTNTNGGRVSGNYIGPDATGAAVIGFQREGILLQNSSNIIIGTNADGTNDATEGNVISGGAGVGGGSAIHLSGGPTTGNIVAGNILGLNAAGTADISAGQVRGVLLNTGANNNRIGGPLAAQRNLISGNANIGIELNNAPDNIIQGNYIGTDITGTLDRGNGLDGIRVGNLSPRNLIGTNGDGINDATEGNLVSGNNGQGISVSTSGPGNDSEDCVIAGNIVGLSTAGTALANSLGGVGLSPGAVNARVGGALLAERNILSGNIGAGLSVTASGVEIQNNYVGTDSTGLLARPNNVGVLVATAAGVTIGGPGASEGNLISGNVLNGVQIQTTTNATVAGNVIGLAADGLTPLGNGGSGVTIIGATGTTVGGSTDAHRNVIADNLFHGITASGNATGLVIRRNWIGLATDGTTAVRNNAAGINLADASGAIVGGATFDDRNVIVAQGDAVFVDAATANAEILRNRIGASADGTTSLISNLRGIHLAGNNATVVGNHVARTNLSYIRVVNSSGHTIRGNLLGTNAAGVPAIGFGGNSGGVAFSNATNIDFGGIAPGEGNTLVSAAQEGLGLAGTTNNVRVRGNAIYANGQLGIDINADGVTANDAGDGDAGPNAVQNYPTITGYTVGGTNVAGSLNSEANTTFDIDLFLNNAADVSGFGEGEIYIGSTTVTTDGVGNGTFNVVIPPANIPGAAFTTTSILTATATHPTNGTSEFSASFIEADPSVDPISSIDVVDGGVTATCPVKLTITFSEPVTDFDANDMEVSANAAVFAVTQVTPAIYTVEVRPLATTPLPALVSCRVNGSVTDLGSNVAVVVSAFFNFTQNAPATNWTIAAGDVYGPAGLVAAMDAANCSNDPNTITLAYRSAYLPNVVDNTLGGIPAYGGNALPQVETPITIEADGATLSSTGIRLFAVVPSGSLTLNRATLTNNGPANQGAAILNRGRLEVVETYFFANAATEFGGAIASPQVASVTRLIRCTFDTNTASMGGGALYLAGNVGGADTNLLENVTLVGNVGAPNGGAAYLLGTTDIRSSTITNNTAGGGGFGGGLFVTTTVAPVTVTMTNTIVAQNGANFGPDVFVDVNPNLTTTSLGYNLVGDNTFGFVAGVGDLLGTPGTPINPQLASLTATSWIPTRTPLATSPARDAANPSLAALPETDARRVPRGLGLLNDRADIGAVELNDFPTAIIENIHPAIGQQKEFWLRAAVADANLIDNGLAEPDTINLTTIDGNYTFDGRPLVYSGFGSNYLPVIATSMNIVGNDAVLERGTTPGLLANGRFVNVAASGSLETSRTTWRNGLMANPFSGGAMDVRGVLVATECTFENNVSFSSGALFVATSSATPTVVRRSTFSGNQAQNTSGGAIGVAIVGAPMLVENSTISGNSAVTNGGGIAAGADLTLANVTLVQNAATQQGGGLFISGGTVTVRNTMVAQNTAPVSGPDIRLQGGTLVDGRYNLLGNNAGAGGVLVNNVNGNIVGTPGTPVNPQIGPLAFNGGPTRTHELLTNSPAIDRIPFADPNGSPAIDQRSSPRPRRFGYDIGAYERFAYFVPCGDIAALRQAINDSNVLPNLDEIFLDNNPCATGYPIADVDNVTDGPNGLPVITSPINFFGLNNTISRATAPGTPDLRLFYVGTNGNVTFLNLSMVGGRLLAPGVGSAQSGAALLNRGIVRFQGTNNLYENQASFGGAIANEFNGNLNIQVGTTLRNNTATAGGAIANWLGGTAGLRNVVIRDNTALFFGGGYVGSVQSTNNMSLVSITNNRSYGYGGGIYIADENTNFFLENVTIGANRADLEGGGVYIGPRLFGNFLMTFTTVAENSAPLGGGVRYQAPVNIGSSIIARNTASSLGPDFNGTVAISSLGYNLVGNNTGVAGFTGTGDLVGTAATPLDPRLSVLGNYAGFTLTYTLLAGSPALDAGHPSSFPPLDQRTFARPVSWSGVLPARPDIGAVEVQADDDRDGIPNSLETDNLVTLRTNLGITNRYIPDSDADGLLDGDERYLHATNPRFPNSDADTLWDGTEVRLRLENPARAAFANPLVNNTGQFTDADNDRLPEALNGVAVVADPGAGNDVDGDGYSDHYEFATYSNNNDAGVLPPLADVDGVAGVTTNDATTIANFAVGNNPAPFVYANADPNGDAIPDAADVTLINLWLFGEVPVLR